jgi:iron complex outermembrane receptor protein
MNIRIRTFKAGLSLVATAGLFTVAARAQTAPQSNELQTLDKFVVTGSYLPLSGAVQASPVVTLDPATIANTGATDALHMLKQMTPYFQGNGNVGTELNNGGSGESNVALRNLTTLVLVNGRRIVGSALSAGTSVDLNTIPTAMVGRLEILKDGASTIYGSDAIGGVVNMLLRKNYNGFEIGGRITSTRNGDFKTKDAYIIGGVSTPTGGITLAAQHFENKPLLTTSRPLTTLEPKQFIALGTAPGGIPAAMSGSFPGRVGNNILAGSPLAEGAAGFKAATTSPGIKTDPNAPPQTIAQLLAAGTYLVIADTPRGKDVGSATILNTTLYGNPLIVNTKREQFVANAFKELSGKNLQVFGDFLLSQNTTGGSGLAPSPISGVGAAGGNSLYIPANNPYNVFGVAFGVGAPAGAPAARARTVELGNRSSVNESNTFRVVAGFRGEINENYNWEFAFNYSRSSALQRIRGGANGANMNKAMVPLIENGKYVYDSKGRPLSSLTDSSGINLPVYNFFALPGFNAAETLDALRADMFQSGASAMRGVDILLRGKPFDLPAGPLAFAVGGENRTEDITTAVDALFANGLALGYGAANPFAGGKRINRAAFLEANAPLTAPKQGLAGLHQVDLTAAVRYEKINPGGSATTPKVGLRWLPLDNSFALRSTWAKGFIAPGIYSLFGPTGQNAPSYTILEGDGRSGSGGATGKTVTGQYGSAFETSNPTLTPSKSDSFTAGFVYSPKQVKGLSITVDYYSITQDKVGSLDYSTIYADLNSKGAASKYAAGFVFADNSRLTTNATNQVTSTNVGSLTVATDPAGDQKTDGMDVSVDYAFSTKDVGRFNVGVNGNWLFNYKWRATPRDPYYQYARVFTDSANGLGGYNGLLPSYSLKPYIHHNYKSLSTSLFFNYLPKVSAPGTLFANQSATNAQRLDGKAYTIPSYFTVDLGLTYTVPSMKREWLKGVTVTAGVNNLLNKEAPYVPGGGNNASESNTAKQAYDIIGRMFFLELKKSF